MQALEKQLFHGVKQANLKYKMIEAGDRIAVGLSGGKDSLALLHALLLLRRFTPLVFQMVAITIDLGWGSDFGGLDNYCQQHGIPLIVEPTRIARIVFEERREKNPCSLCSNLRKGALHRVAISQGCNKVALAHHLDDAVVTFLLSMVYEGQARCFHPSSFLDRTGLTLVRPLIYVPEALILKLAERLAFPVLPNPCPASRENKRTVIAQWLSSLEAQEPKGKMRMLHAIEQICWQAKE